MTTSQQQYRKAESVVTRKIAGEVLLVPVRGNLASMDRIFALNAVGEFIWHKLDEGNDFHELGRQIADHFDVNPAQVLTDLVEFLSELKAEGLLVEAGEEI